MAAVLLAWLGEGRLSAAWLLLPAAGFVGLVIWHERTARAIRRAARSVLFHEQGLARLQGLPSSGPSPTFPVDEGHPYAADLDLFGPGSLFERLCGASTRGGEEALARWLLGPAPPDEIRSRQAAVRELRDRLDLREDLFLLGDAVRAEVHADAIQAWAAAAPVPFPGAARASAALLAALNLAALAGWWGLDLGPGPLLLCGALSAIWAGRLRDRVRHVLAAVEVPARELPVLCAVLERLEGERFQSPHLLALHAALQAGGRPPSSRVAELRRLLELRDSVRNQIFAPLAGLTLWTTQVAMAVEAWRSSHGAAVVRWLQAAGEIEALCSLASRHFEHPEDAFPEILEVGPRFEAEGLAHPLLAETRAVRNDVRLDAEQRALLVSGSNMSGKSTLLRSIGTNLVLAQAGAPVRARRLVLSPLALGASIRVHDSLQAGESRFYAEIRRLRLIVDLARDRPPLLFLLDEVLHGTNSAERRLGAEAIVRGLLARGAVGALTTHDLALAEIAGALPGVRNVHFEDHLEDGRMAFDYRMREGVVTRSNALALMRAIGLEV